MPALVANPESATDHDFDVDSIVQDLIRDKARHETFIKGFIELLQQYGVSFKDHNEMVTFMKKLGEAYIFDSQFEEEQATTSPSSSTSSLPSLVPSDHGQ